MAVNDIIKEAEYNSIRNKLTAILGTGTETSGWGQTILSPAITAGNSVTINEFGRLRFDIINAWTHIFGSAPTPLQVVVGDTIRFDPTTAPITAYDTIIDTIVANKFTVGQTGTEAATPSLRTATWSTSVSCTVSASFPSATAARHFFNSGGQIRINSNFLRRSGVNTSQNISWESLLTAAGTQQLGGNNPGTGTSPSNGQNWYRLTNSYQQWYSTSGSTPYGSNSYRISARCNVANNSSGTASSAEFLVEFIDGYRDPDALAGNPETSNQPTDIVDGSLTVSPSSLYATGVLVPSGSGMFTVTRPTITVGAIT
jgi:hypothetical protein